MEACLAGFCRRHLPEDVDPGVQVLLAGLGPAPSTVPDHAVQSVDWLHPTAGELDARMPAGPAPDGVAARRKEAESACRAALGHQPAQLRRFDTLLAVAQRYAVLREEQARDLTLAWPVLRACALRLGDGLRQRDALEHRDDVFFLRRPELRAGDHRAMVRARRDQWQRQRRLAAPLTVGRDPLLPDAVAGAVAKVARGAAPTPHAIVGQPASSGRATGAVRIVHGPEDFPAFQTGEILVTRTTAPAWTPLLARAAAVVTDGGSLAAHASLIAREYGIPAVVATGDATVRLHQGQVVTVDGNAGTVEVAHSDRDRPGQLSV
jgi:pyruvate,water dikinase